MVYPGRVQNGVIVLDQGVRIPDGTPVSVEVAHVGEATTPGDEIPSLLERLSSVVGAAEGLPPDAAANVDHYFYGHPRR